MMGTQDRTGATAHVAVLPIHGQYGLVATDTVATGTTLFFMEGIITEVPSRYSVQIDRALHLDVPGSHPPEGIDDRYSWRFLNHSCEPNCVIRGRELIAVKTIEPDQEITFNYNTTEYDIAETFDCYCGSANCVGRISGFRFLPRAERERLRPWLAEHLRSMLGDDPAPTGTPR
jgi:hypothetical protein